MQLKRITRNNGGVSLLHGKMGLQYLVDNHTSDDNLQEDCDEKLWKKAQR